MTRVALLLIVLCTAPNFGCAWVVHTASQFAQSGDRREGVTYYVGGAGPVGHVGSLDVPLGLQDAGYRGRVHVFTWQGLTHAGDQIDLSKNRERGAELAELIRRDRFLYPHARLNVIALSAGTGVATFALEFLPERIQVDTVVFLGCSLSSRYDLTRALKRVRRGLYCVHSPEDRILGDVVWYTGTVDRSSASGGVAGLVGFVNPREDFIETGNQYAKLRNIPYRPEFARSGYLGGHLDCVSRSFVRDYIAGLILGTHDRILPRARPPAVDEPFTPPQASRQ